MKDNPLLSDLRCAAWIFVSCSVVQYSSLDLKCRGCSVVKCTFGFVKLARNLTLSGRRIYVAWPGVTRERERDVWRLAGPTHVLASSAAETTDRVSCDARRRSFAWHTDRRISASLAVRLSFTSRRRRRQFLLASPTRRVACAL